MSRITHYFLLLFYLILYLTYDSVSKSLRKMPVIEANFTNDDITETQHTICKIATEDVIANAHATTVLTKSKIMDEKFASLEDRLIKEFANIKWILNNILEQQSNYLKSIQNANLYDAISDNYLSPRQDEIDKVNNSMQNLPILNGSVKAFIYYWQVKNFNMMLMNWQTGRSMRSSTFYAGQSGYAMYLKITPKYFPDGTVFVGVGLTRGRYDSVLAWPFPYRIRLEVLDHSLEGAREDRRSRIWDPITLCTEDFWGRPRTADNPECVGLSIPRRVILSKSLIITASQRYLGNTRYMWNGSVLIKLVVYL
ncbi:TNF receptor-associated factor 6-like [Pogonomyrmex barbatus]|uniref:TNF receptor-associated factor 6-like n=1 Tax=Pogonomyrmex barbatus TaxID=144034 RepID=A0A6I9WD85_9HYME|nr:TNF receptor-associated factor 6-like [Pogonomyrmex barbatus]